MKTIVKVIASTLLISSAFALNPAYADNSSSNASFVASPKDDAKRNMNVEKHIKKLHAELKITPEEETQWAIVATTIHDNADQMDEAIDKREALYDSATAVDDLNAYSEIAQAHADGIRNLTAAFTPLYAQMSDDQKEVADDVFLRRTHKGMNKHHGMN